MRRDTGDLAAITRGQVRQAGTRNLWDEAVTAYQWWTTNGHPDRAQFHQFHLTVIPQHQCVWLDDPANTVTTFT